jgi:hypothetical protein
MAINLDGHHNKEIARLRIQPWQTRGVAAAAEDAKSTATVYRKWSSSHISTTLRVHRAVFQLTVFLHWHAVGYYWKTNQYGLTIDTVTVFELVLPNG